MFYCINAQNKRKGKKADDVALKKNQKLQQIEDISVSKNKKLQL